MNITEPAITPPIGTEADAWQNDERGDYRILYGISRGITGRPDIVDREPPPNSVTAASTTP